MDVLGGFVNATTMGAEEKMMEGSDDGDNDDEDDNNNINNNNDVSTDFYSSPETFQSTEDLMLTLSRSTRSKSETGSGAPRRCKSMKVNTGHFF